MLAGEGLHPTSRGKRVRFSGKERTVIDGPFSESKDLIAGFWLWPKTSTHDAPAFLNAKPSDHVPNLLSMQLASMSAVTLS
jgi:hypothetical protein